MVPVDLVTLTVRDDDFHVLLVTRGEIPYRGRLALPDGFVQIDEGQDTGTSVAGGPGRPATLYRAGTATTLTPPLTRERLGPPTNSRDPYARG